MNCFKDINSSVAHAASLRFYLVSGCPTTAGAELGDNRVSLPGTALAEGLGGRPRSSQGSKQVASVACSTSGQRPPRHSALRGGCSILISGVCSHSLDCFWHSHFSPGREHERSSASLLIGLNCSLAARGRPLIWFVSWTPESGR